MTKDLDYYRGLPYTRRKTRFQDKEDGKLYYCVFFEQLPDVKGIHQEELRAIKLAQELFDSYILAQLEWDEDIPEPNPRFRKRGGLWKFKKVETASWVVRPTRVQHPVESDNSSRQTSSGARPRDVAVA